MSEQMEVLKAWMLGREEVTYGDKIDGRTLRKREYGGCCQ